MSNKNLVNVRKENEVLVVSSREVADNFEKRHSDVLEKIRILEEQINNQPTEKSVRYFIPSEYTDNKKEFRKEYLLTEDGFSLIVMGFNGEKALKFKLVYINEFKKMKETLNQIIPILTEEQKLQLSIFNAKTKEDTIMASVDLDRFRRKQIAEKDEIILLQGNKTSLYDDFMNSKNLYSIDVVSKTFAIKNFGKNNIFKYLRENKIIMTDLTVNRKGEECVGANHYKPYAMYVNNQQYFKIRMRSFVYENTTVNHWTGLLTSLGVNWFYKKIQKDGYIIEKDLETIVQELKEEQSLNTAI